MKVKVRRLNDAGLERMETFLRSLTGEHPESYPEEILTDAATSEALPVPIEVERRDFPRRFELAEYLYERIEGNGLQEAERDKGLWAWLALYWFDMLCPEKKGKRKPGEMARWLPRIDAASRYYRHLLLGPYLVYKTHADDPTRALALLPEPPFVATAEVYRLFIEGPLVASKAAVSTATTLYYSAETAKLRRGACAKAPGGARRLVACLQQFDRTYDLQTMTPEGLFAILPKEFDRFKKSSNGRK